MHSWKKKLVVSQLALACTLAITSQANAATNDISGQTYNTFHHYNDATYADDVYYDGYVGWNNYAADSYYNGDIGNDSNLLIVFYVQIMPDDFVMQLHR
ncbi:hypothetical protein P9478_21460, partial [Escherichia coli]